MLAPPFFLRRRLVAPIPYRRRPREVRRHCGSRERGRWKRQKWAGEVRIKQMAVRFPYFDCRTSGLEGGLVKVHGCGVGSIEVKENVMSGAALKQKKTGPARKASISPSLRVLSFNCVS